MSQENVELVRAAYEAIARRDREALAAILTDHLTPDFEFEAVLTGATYRGVDALWERRVGSAGGRRALQL